MNVAISYKPNVKTRVRDELANELPRIISETMDTGYVVRVKPDQIALAFTSSSPRDTGADIKIIVFAQRNEPRISTEDARAKMILDRVLAASSESGEKYSVDVRIYLMEIGAAESH